MVKPTLQRNGVKQSGTLKEKSNSQLSVDVKLMTQFVLQVVRFSLLVSVTNQNFLEPEDL